ncbi:MAG: DUF2130 domain-containing protein [Cytophaga sp.]|uniref:DUF2130 domain-containing protein n=1 Tax=Cytophaga sp. TaxID=29535 RepID=UPI003F7E63A3
MSSINQITCPNCGHHFHAEQALAKQIEAEVMVRVQKDADERKKQLDEAELKLRNLQKNLVAEKAQMEETMKANMAREKSILEQQLRKQLSDQINEQVAKENATMLESMRADLEKKNKENQELKIKEVELMRAEQKLKDVEQDMKLNFEKQLLEQKKTMAEEIQKQADEQNLAKNREKDAQLDQLRRQIDEMKRKAEQGSMQLQGEAQELFLEDLLKTAFPFDLIEEVGKGVRGADIIQTVRNNQGRDCGTIIYEAKNTKAFSEGWIDKLKSDLRSQKASLAVLVTSVMPKEMTTFGIKDGIWICTFEQIKGLSHVLRDGLIKVTEAKGAEENRGEKMQMLYSYLTGHEFRQQVEAIVEAFSSMQSALHKEKIAMNKIWKEREKQIDKVIESTVGMYGSIRGIAGNAVGEIKALELDNDDELLLEE